MGNQLKSKTEATSKMKSTLSLLTLATLSYANSHPSCHLKYLPDGAEGAMAAIDYYDPDFSKARPKESVALLGWVDGFDPSLQGTAFVATFTGYNNFEQSDIDLFNQGLLSCDDIHDIDLSHRDLYPALPDMGYITLNQSGHGRIWNPDINIEEGYAFSVADALNRFYSISDGVKRYCCFVTYS